MKHFLRNVLAAFLAVSTIFIATSCDHDVEENKPVPSKTLLSIVISEKPTKFQYSIGDNLDTTGLKVIAYYSDDTKEDVTASCKITGFDSATEGNKTVTVSYTEDSITLTDSFIVSVQSNNPDNPNNPIDNPDKPIENPDDNKNTITAGDIILADGTIVKKENYTSIVSTNPPVAVVVEHNDKTDVTLGLGLYSSEERLEFTPRETYGYNLNATECTIGNGYLSGISAKDATFTMGYTKGNTFWSLIYNTKYNNEAAQAEFSWEVSNAKKYFPAFYWANTYGETYKDYLGNVTSGWYVPSIAEMASIYKNVEKINASLNAIKSLGAGYSSGEISGAYWSSSNCASSNVHQGGDVNAWYMDFDYSGYMQYNYKNNKFKVLAVRSFKKSDSTKTATLSSIAVTKAPDKTKYILNSNEKLDKTGLKVTAYYSDNTAKDVTSEVTVDTENAFDLSSLATTKVIKITYGGEEAINTTQFPIAVIEEPVLESLVIEGKQSYLVGDSIDITVKAIYSDKSTQDVTSSAIITGFDSSAPVWNKSLSISYTEAEVTLEENYQISVNKYLAGSIVLADGKVVSKDNFTFDSSNRPVAVVAGTTSTGKVLGVGLYATLRSKEYYKWYSKNDTLIIRDSVKTVKCYPTSYKFRKYEDGYSMDATKDAIFTGDTDGSNNLKQIEDAIYEFNIEDFPALEWASTYGETFKDYLGSVTSGWYLPSLPELCTVYRNIEAINEALSVLSTAMGESNYPSAYVESNQYGIPTTSIYWTSSPDDYSGLCVWIVSFYEGFASNREPKEVSSVLAVHTFD